MTEDEMVRWHYQHSEHEFEQTPRDGEDRGARHSAIHEVAESDMTDGTTTIKSSFLLTPFPLFDIFLLFQKKLLL